MFFELLPTQAVVSDSNRGLISTYNVIKHSPDELRGRLQEYALKHSDAFYYAVRSSKPDSEIDIAVRFLYLNRTCWNGLYRVNLAGVFNVPRGTKDQVILQTDDFNAVSIALKGTEAICSDFEPIINRAKDGDTIFCDPPYTVKHNTNGFVKYNERIFSWSDQVRLAGSVRAAAARGVLVFVSNANHPTVLDLYRDASSIVVLPRASVLAGKSSFRCRTTEIVVCYNG